MTKTPGGGYDLREFQNDDSKVIDIFSKIVSGGKFGYKTVIEKKKDEKRCANCHVPLQGVEKFCPECGAKTEWQIAAEKPVVLLTSEELEQKFKSGQESESEILAYLRDALKMPDFAAFELINRWRREMRPVTEETKIDLNQFKG